MKQLNDIYTGIREMGTNKLIAVYPKKVSGNYDEVKQTVMDWYYNSSCSAEDYMRDYFFDTLSEKELKTVENSQKQHPQKH